MSREEIKLLLNEVRDDEQGYIFVLLSLSTGGRFNTVMNITKRDLRLEQNFVMLKDSKNEGTYYGYYDDITKDILIKYINNLKARDSLIEIKSDAMHFKIGKKIMNKLFNKDLETTDRKYRVVIHSLRHTFASHLAMNGASIITIKNLMHHANIEMTLRYSHLMPDSGKSEVMGLYH